VLDEKSTDISHRATQEINAASSPGSRAGGNSFFFVSEKNGTSCGETNGDGSTLKTVQQSI
jgi:hypothetical protein